VNRRQANLEQLKIVADSLGDLRQRSIFVGGSIIGLLVSDHAIRDVRATDDVDIVIEVASYAKYAVIQDILRDRGFQHVMDGPNCRFKIRGTVVDVMPSDDSILGFHNRWYPLIFERPLRIDLSNGLTIAVIDPALFLCTKLEAFHDRGKSDYVISHDIEDIVTILYGRSEIFQEICQAPKEPRDYLIREFKNILSDNLFHEALPGMIPPGPAGEEAIIVKRMNVILKWATSTEWLETGLSKLSEKSDEASREWDNLL
jgi:hypothetical protein